MSDEAEKNQKHGEDDVGPQRCPHCGELIVASEDGRPSAVRTCPHCGLALQEGHVA
ncbi:MAG TPA: hypothetical protein VNA25_08695 [Phycisphaerae bacterium]|nr:hypothetical protein [Phycisphaerae bacterium]